MPSLHQGEVMTNQEMLDSMRILTRDLVARIPSFTDNQLKLFADCLLEYHYMALTVLGSHHKFDPNKLAEIHSEEVMEMRRKIANEGLDELERLDLLVSIKEASMARAEEIQTIILAAVAANASGPKN